MRYFFSIKLVPPRSSSEKYVNTTLSDIGTYYDIIAFASRLRRKRQNCFQTSMLHPPVDTCYFHDFFGSGLYKLKCTVFLPCFILLIIINYYIIRGVTIEQRDLHSKEILLTIFIYLFNMYSLPYKFFLRLMHRSLCIFH